jgi:hypothetical protein
MIIIILLLSSSPWRLSNSSTFLSSHGDDDDNNNYYDYYIMMMSAMKKRIMIMPIMIIRVCWYADVIGMKVIVVHYLVVKVMKNLSYIPSDNAVCFRPSHDSRW